MKYVVISIRDSAAAVFSSPRFLQNVAVARRQFSDAISNVSPDNQMYLHPEDFELYELGSYDDQSAEFTLLSKPRCVARGVDFGKKPD